MDSFLFEMVGLDGEAWSPDAALTRLVRAAEGLGHTVDEGEAIGDWRKLELSGPLPTATIMVSGPKAGWALDLDGGVLGDEEDPTDEQRAVVDLLAAAAGAVPLYLGTAVWPFGPETPPSYDTSAPFAAEQAGPVMYVSRAYVEAILGGAPVAPPKGWAARPAGPGDLLVVTGNLLRDPEDKVVRRLLKRLRPSR
jgi:hypothetical protein